MKNYLKVIKILFTVEKKLLIKALVIIILLLGIEAGIPIYMNWMLKEIEIKQDIKSFAFLLVIFAIAYLVFSIIDSFRAYYNEFLGKHILWETREKIYNVLWGGDYLNDISNNKDRFKFVLTNETYSIFTFASIYSINLMVNFLTIVVLFIPITIINPIVSLLLLLSIILSLFISFFSGKKILYNYEKCDDAREEDVRINIETVDLLETTRVNGLGDYYIKKNKEALDHFINVSAKADRDESFWTNIESAIHSFVYVMIAGIMILTNNNLSGKLVTALFIANLVLDVSQQFQHQIQVLIKNIAVFDKVDSVSDIKITKGDTVTPIKSIEFRHIGVEYDNNQKILSDFCNRIELGDRVLIEGQNGSGKSTLVKMITGLVTPSYGQVLINGKNISEINPNSLYKEVCYISQNELFLNESIEEYLGEVTHRRISKKEMERIKKIVNFKEEKNSISDNGNSLSGGERKKLQMMKLLIRKEASVYILDEVDAGLDIETRNILKTVEIEIMKNTRNIVIKISHIDQDKTGYNKVISL